MIVGLVKRTEGPVWAPEAQADEIYSGGSHAERVVDLFVVALSVPDLRHGPCIRYVAPEDLSYVEQKSLA